MMDDEGDNSGLGTEHAIRATVKYHMPNTITNNSANEHREKRTSGRRGERK